MPMTRRRLERLRSVVWPTRTTTDFLLTTRCFLPLRFRAHRSYTFISAPASLAVTFRTTFIFDLRLPSIWACAMKCPQFLRKRKANYRHYTVRTIRPTKTRSSLRPYGTTRPIGISSLESALLGIRAGKVRLQSEEALQFSTCFRCRTCSASSQRIRLHLLLMEL